MRVRELAGAAAIAAVLVALAACGDGREAATAGSVPTIACLGDSITAGIVRGAPAGRDPLLDSRGGFPGRLADRLAGRARVLNRGIGSTTAMFWAAAPDTEVGRAMWALVQRAPWYEPRLVSRAPSAAVAVLAPERPDAVIVLLGVNDLYARRRADAETAVQTALDDLTTLAAQLRAVTAHVLVATPLPNRRDAPDRLAAFTAGIHARFPDALPLGERFAALAWESLLADGIHPTEAGHERVAMLLEDLLVERGIVPAGG